MIGGLDFRNELMGLPGGSWIVDQFDKWGARISGVWGVEHYDNGQHKDIIADSVTTEDLTVNDQFRATNLSASGFVRIGSQNPSLPGVVMKQSGSELQVFENDGTTPTTVNAFKGEFLPTAGSGGTVTTNTFVGDVVSEYTADAGVTVDGVLLKDGFVDGGLIVSQTTSATGTQNNFDLDGRFVLLRCTGAAPVFTGFTVNGSAPAAGDSVRIVCLGTTAKVTTQDTGSTAANRVICPSTAGQIIGVNGVMDLVYDGTTQRWREALVDPGKPITPTFAASDFIGVATGTWTVAAGDATTMMYQQRGKLVKVWVFLETTSVTQSGAGPTQLQIQNGQWGGFTVASAAYAPSEINDNGTQRSASLRMLAGETVIRLSAVPAVQFANSTDATEVYGTLEAEID